MCDRYSLKFKQLIHPLLEEDGVALLQVILIGSALIALGYSLIFAVSGYETRSRKMYTKNTYNNVAAFVQQQTMDTEGLICSSRVTQNIGDGCQPSLQGGH